MTKSSPIGRRQCADLCREFLTASKDVLRDTFRTAEGQKQKAIPVLRNLGFAFCDALPYVFQDEVLNALMRRSSRDFPRALIARRQDTIAIQFADNAARHILRCENYGVEDLRDAIPDSMRSSAMKDFLDKNGLSGLQRVLGHK